MVRITLIAAPTIPQVRPAALIPEIPPSALQAVTIAMIPKAQLNIGM